MSQYFAYIHCKPDNSIFYVGKGTHSRANRIASGTRNVHHKRIVNKYGRDNISVGVIPCSSESIAFDLEVGIIKCARRMGFVLANMTDGGEGQSGRKQTAEEKEKRAIKLRGQKRNMETRDKMRAANTGKKLNQSTKDKLSVIFSNRPLPPAFIAAWIPKFGATNPRAKAVIGRHPEQGVKYFDTLTAAAVYVSGSVAKVCRAIKLSHRHKGWRFEYNKKEIL